MSDFWNSLLTEKSWEILKELRKEHNFILIGGWAAYLIAERQKSKDIDIVVDLNELHKLKQENIMGKNDKLRKYEIKKQDIDVDIYLEHYSKLAIPVEDIKNYTINLKGFNVACPELMIVLKQSAYFDRKDSVKGEKDLIDIISILFFSEIDFEKYNDIIKKYSLENYLRSLYSAVSGFNDFNKLNLSPKEFKLKKREILDKIRGVF